MLVLTDGDLEVFGEDLEAGFRDPQLALSLVDSDRDRLIVTSECDGHFFSIDFDLRAFQSCRVALQHDRAAGNVDSENDEPGQQNSESHQRAGDDGAARVAC